MKRKISCLMVMFFCCAVCLSASGKKDAPAEDIKLEQAADGTYEGKSRNWPVSVTVEVSISEHRISDITIIRHFEGRGESAEAIVGKVLASQSLDVDVISGATVSSRTILEAIADALKKGIKE